ncbi:MAG TPA: LysR substrate-binding domain-containing protein [Roseiarcus sp.]|nr:LysR substrate-binding domain-containing protein [Roseiarcus sp.]
MDEIAADLRIEEAGGALALRGDPLARNRLKLTHLRLIVALEEHEMVSAAASAVAMSQPAASRMIAEMEGLIDAPLCERLARGVRLTPLGLSLARHARAVLLQLAQAEREISDLRNGRAGSAALGAVTGPAIDLAAPAIAKLRTIYPAVELTIKIDTSSVLARDLLASRLDFIIARVPDDLNPRLFDCQTIGVEEACLIVRRGHPLSGHGPVSVRQLAAYEWVIQPRGTPLRRTVETMFLAEDVALPERLSNTTSLLLTMIMVANSNAIAPMSIEAARFVAQGAPAGPIEILPTKHPIVIQPYSLITVRNRAMPPAVQSVYEFIRQEALGGSA